MTSSSPTLFNDVQVYLRSGHIALHHLTERQIDEKASNIVSSISAFPPLDSFRVNRTVLENYNRWYTEKRIHGIDRHFLDYSGGVVALSSQPSIPPPRHLRYLDSRFYSGDVSGQIGESLFVYFLVERRRLNRRNIGHLRPQKLASYLTCDYLIWDRRQVLSSIIQGMYSSPLYAEVKSSTGDLTEGSVSHGLCQLKESIGNTSKHGLLSLVSRKQETQGYGIYLVVVRG